ncbi:SDR family oxidoreductase [Pseudomonas chlororaphis]|uniref:SDR family oxidoreductase n=1 Tax=Pseudomonas chlororaphis TaxID=587753 RepID=UPI0007B3FAAC|nr:SDR family oxidoreductase [Pseudomonas chlororaphis]AZC63547.1 3-oxoacyl-ACP reductase [Pseudomonas chlororaphis subsp. piscium]AZC69785.1 3-oxoacyl-ACP reductase [Pseudomonas chlororaphis subsp. piscium]AZC82265.1 3-oxoacyl-ACP reductase [Pseudomonas chlororaphis subsp. piscium]AZC89451.1 3-oxoacyl-ACP reductase [Pseudomonas chlororaphis subsp. piscium]KZO49868.1 short-chain dehydrogenase [Pseudomonas chlororaphis subsp. piscium]
MKTRTFLITGASKGIGRALANQLSQAGHHVVGIARNSDDPDFPGTLVSLDLGDREQTGKTLAGLVSRYAFDGLINNVGLVRPQALGDVQLDDFDEVMRINLHSALQATQALLPGMRNRGWGRIVNISSLTILGIPHRTAYAAAKAALVSFTRSWALELATSGITVNTIAPGPTETELFRAGNPLGSDGEARYLASVPMGRLGQPDEIAAAIAFLLSEQSGFITGQTLFVDGGASIGKSAF